MDIYRTIHTAKAGYAFFLSTLGTFIKVDDMSQRTSQQISKINMQTTFSEKNTMTVETNYKKIVKNSIYLETQSCTPI